MEIQWLSNVWQTHPIFDAFYWAKSDVSWFPKFVMDSETVSLDLTSKDFPFEIWNIFREKIFLI